MPLCCKSRKRTPCPTACVTWSHFRILQKTFSMWKDAMRYGKPLYWFVWIWVKSDVRSEYLNDYGNHIWLLHEVVRYLKYTCNHIWCKSNYFQVGAAVAVLPKTSCAFAMSGTIKLWKPEDISEHNILFLEMNFKFTSLQVVTICSWRNCVCCFQDVATPISICQQSYFAYMLYHRRKPLNSKYAINSKTQACFCFKVQKKNSQEDF